MRHKDSIRWHKEKSNSFCKYSSKSDAELIRHLEMKEMQNASVCDYETWTLNYLLTHLYCHLAAEGLARGDGVPIPQQEHAGMDAWLLKNIFYLKSFQIIMCSFNVHIISGMGQEIDYMHFIVTVIISNWLLPHFNENNGSLNRKTYTSHGTYAHTNCTCWRTMVQTGSKHMLIEKSSQTAGPATSERGKKSFFIDAPTCAPTGSNEALCMVRGNVDVDGNDLPHLSEALHRALRQSWTENGSLWPALNGTRTGTY